MLEKYTWFRIPENVVTSIEFKELQPTAKTVYLELCRLAFRYGDKSTGYFFRSLNSLAFDCHLDKKSVINAKKKLKSLDFIEVKRGIKHSNGTRSSDSYKINGLKMIGES